jgi:hypothetical protein
MATQAFEKDSSNCVAGGRVSVLPIDGLVAAPAEMRYAPCATARPGCTVNCPRFAQCGSMDRQAFAGVVSPWIRV